MDAGAAAAGRDVYHREHYFGAGRRAHQADRVRQRPVQWDVHAVSARIGIPYAVYTPIFNLALFGLELLFGRKYIHIGTFVNCFCCAMQYVFL